MDFEIVPRTLQQNGYKLLRTKIENYLQTLEDTSVHKQARRTLKRRWALPRLSVRHGGLYRLGKITRQLLIHFVLHRRFPQQLATPLKSKRPGKSFRYMRLQSQCSLIKTTVYYDLVPPSFFLQMIILSLHQNTLDECHP